MEKKEKYERIIIKRGNHPLGRNHHFRPKTPARSAHPLCFARPDQPLPPRAHWMRVQPVSLKVFFPRADCLSLRLGPQVRTFSPNFATAGRFHLYSARFFPVDHERGLVHGLGERENVKPNPGRQHPSPTSAPSAASGGPNDHASSSPGMSAWLLHTIANDLALVVPFAAG